VIVKYDSSGLALWARSTTTNIATSTFRGVSIDSDGNSYAVGQINGTGTYNFGSGITVSGASTAINIVIIKYDPDGTPLWAKSTSSGTSSAQYYGVSTDADGNSYAVGQITGTGSRNFGSGITVRRNGTNVVVKYDTSGATLWGKSLLLPRRFELLWNINRPPAMLIRLGMWEYRQFNFGMGSRQRRTQAIMQSLQIHSGTSVGKSTTTARVGRPQWNCS
jgi:hypothetical protein